MQAAGDLVAKATFQDFAPAPCICLGFLVPEAQQRRTSALAYVNRMVITKPMPNDGTTLATDRYGAGVALDTFEMPPKCARIREAAFDPMESTKCVERGVV